MLFDHVLADQLSALHPSFVDDDLMVLSQLNLVVFDGLVEILILVAAFLDVVDNLKKVDGNRKYLPSSLQHFLVFFKLRLVLFFELLLVLGLVVRTLQHRLKLALTVPIRFFERG